VFDRAELALAAGTQRGGYVLWEATTTPEVILIGTGSEVNIVLEAGRMLEKEGIAARVVSLPSWELFDAQPEEYRNQVLPPDIRARVSMEAGSPVGWERYTGLDGVVIGLHRFGASAPYKVIYEKLGLTAQHMVDEAKRLVGGKA
jgi:transketolase